MTTNNNYLDLQGITSNYLKEVAKFKEKMHDIEDEIKRCASAIEVRELKLKDLKIANPTLPNSIIAKEKDYIRELRKKKKRLEHHSLYECIPPSWVDYILEPLANELKERTNAIECEIIKPSIIATTDRDSLECCKSYLKGTIRLKVKQGKLLFKREEIIQISLVPGYISKGEIMHLSRDDWSGWSIEELPNNFDDIIKIMK